MNSKQEIFDRLSAILSELFEIPSERISGTAKLYDDLDIDSIDAVDIIVELRKITGKKVSPEEFKAVRTVDDVVEAVYRLLQEE